MTSKISFSKFLKEDIRQRAWLAVSSWILLFLTGPVYAMLSMDGKRETLGNDYSAAGLYRLLLGMLNGSAALPLAMTIFLLAIFCGATGFCYLHSAEKTDFYHSLPLTRTSWFWIAYTGGLVIFLPPYLISSLCTVLFGITGGFMTASALPFCLLAVFGGVLSFLVIYHVAILAMMLTGKVIPGIMGALALIVYGNMIGELVQNLSSVFFVTYSGSSSFLLSRIAEYLSPASLYVQLLCQSSSEALARTVSTHVTNSWIGIPYQTQRFFVFSERSIFSLAVLLPVTAAVLALTVLLSVLLYRRRLSEAAGNALAFPKTAPFIKVLVAVPTSLYLGLFLSSLYGSGKKWVILISLFSVFLLCGIIEFIYHTDLKKIFAGKCTSLISVLCVAGILCILQFDLIGYDTWLPEESRLEGMTFTSDCLDNYFSWFSGSYLRHPSHDPDLMEKGTELVQDFTPLYALAQEGIENAKNGITFQGIYSEEFAENYITVTLQFLTKGRGSAYRSYVVKREHALQALRSICENEDYRKFLFPVFQLDYSDIVGIQLSDIYTMPETLYLTPAQQEALLDAYKRDVLQVDINTLQTEAPIGEFIIDVPDYDTLQYDENEVYTESLYQFYIYEDYADTLALLQEYGYHIRTKINPEDVLLLTLTKNYPSSAEGLAVDASQKVRTASFTTVTDPEETEKILAHVRYYAPGILDDRTYDYSAYSAEITLIGSGAAYYPLDDSYSP